MHASIFHYNLSRPYPFRWFTPVAIVGGLVLVALLSLMNFVQNSYVLGVEYASNPNATISKGVWFKNWPSYLAGSVKPVCQPANLPINSEFFTNHTALTYTITSVFEGDGQSSDASPSLPYMNNLLDKCKITLFELQFDGAIDQSWAAYSSSTWNIDMRAYATCQIWGPMGRTVFNLTAEYNPITATGDVPGTSRLISRNIMTKATSYWSEALLSAYWVDTVSTVWNKSLSLDLGKGVLWFRPHKGATDINSLQFFDMNYNFYTAERNSGPYLHDDWHTTEHYINRGNKSQPQIWLPADRLAKSMYSTVMADLGQTNANHGPSLLNDPATLQKYSSRFSWIANNSDIITTAFSPLEQHDYETLKRQGETGPLEFSPAVIATKYLCQVPKLKSAGDILMSVLLADLVFLSLAWRLFTLGVDYFLDKQPSANYCEGCLRGESDGMRLLSGASAQVSQDFQRTLPATYLPLGSTPDEHEEAMVGDGRREGFGRWNTK